MAELVKKRNRNNTTAFASANINNNQTTNKNMPLNFTAPSPATTTTTVTSRPAARSKLSSKMRRFVRNLSNPPSFPILRNSLFEQQQEQQQQKNSSILQQNNPAASFSASGGDAVFSRADEQIKTLSGNDVNFNDNLTSTISVIDEQQSINVSSSASFALPPICNNGNSEINHQQRLQQQRNRRRRLRHFTVINIAESIRNRLSGGGNNNIHNNNNNISVPSAESLVVVGGDGNQQQETKKLLFNADDIISDACSRLAHGNVTGEQRTAAESSDFFNIVESSKKKQQQQHKNYDILSGGVVVVSLPSRPDDSSIKSTQQQESSQTTFDTLRDARQQQQQHTANWFGDSGLTYSGNQSFANSSFPVYSFHHSASPPPPTTTHNNIHNQRTTSSFKCDYKSNNNACSVARAETSLHEDATQSAIHQRGEERAASNIINTIVSNEREPPSQSLILHDDAVKNHYADHIARHLQHASTTNVVATVVTVVDHQHNNNNDSVFELPRFTKAPVTYPDFVLQGASLSPKRTLASSTPHLAAFPQKQPQNVNPLAASNFTVISKHRVIIPELNTTKPTSLAEQLPLSKRLVKRRHARGTPHRQTICTSQIVVSTVKYNDHHHHHHRSINTRDGACTATTAAATTLPRELPGLYAAAEHINTRPSSSAAAVSSNPRLPPRHHHFYGSTTRLSNSIQHLLTALGGRAPPNSAGAKHRHGSATKTMAFASPFYTANKVANYYTNNNNGDSSLPDDSNETTDFAEDDDLRAHMATAAGTVNNNNRLNAKSRNGRFETTSSGGAEESSFIYKYLQGSVTRQTPECLYARTGEQLPVYVLRPFSRQLRACITGPEEGIANIPHLGAHKQQQTNQSTLQLQQRNRSGGPVWQQALLEKQGQQMSAVTRALLYANRKETSQLALEDFIALLLRDEVTSKCHNKNSLVESQQKMGFRNETARQSDDNVSLNVAAGAESATTTGEEFIESYEEKTLAEQLQNSDMRKTLSIVSVTHVGSAPTATIEELNENLGATTPMTCSSIDAENDQTTPKADNYAGEDEKTPTNDVDRTLLTDAVATAESLTPTENIVAIVSTEQQNNSSNSSTTTRSNSVIMSAPEVPLFLHENENKSITTTTTSHNSHTNVTEKTTDERPTAAVGHEQQLATNSDEQISQPAQRNSSAGDEAAAVASAVVSNNLNSSGCLSEDECAYAEKEEATTTTEAVVDEEESYSSAPEMRQLASVAAERASAQQRQDKSIFQSRRSNEVQQQTKPLVSATSSLPPPTKPQRSTPRPLRHQHNSIASSMPASGGVSENHHRQNKFSFDSEPAFAGPLQKAATQVTRGLNFMPRITLPFPTINPEEDTPAYHWLPPPSAQDESTSPWSTKIFGISRSLYERNIHTAAAVRSGDPVADTYAAVAMDNGGILVVADGVNWGEKARLAARCAIKGALDFLLASINSHGYYVWTTKDLFASITLAFHAAHNLILQEHATLTTLCVAVVLPAFAGSTPDEQAQLNRAGIKQYVVCVANVGDSFAYVYSARSGVREITIGSHDVYSMRDMRDALGALGPVDEHFPELANFTCSLTFVDAGDIVFLCSDGISDNFDPVVGKFCVMREISTTNNGDNTNSSSSLPTVEAYQRHELMLLRFEDLLFNGIAPPGAGQDDEKCRGARQLCTLLVTFAEQMTAAKRHILEDPDLYPAGRLSRAQQRLYRRKACERLALIPGKLDHATVVAYQAGHWNVDYSQTFNTAPVPNWIPPPAAAVVVSHPSSAVEPTKNDADGYVPAVANTVHPVSAEAKSSKKLDLAKADSLMSLAIDEDQTAATRKPKDESLPKAPPYLAGLAQRLEELAQQRAAAVESETSPPPPSRDSCPPAVNATAIPLRSALIGSDAVLLKDPNDDNTTIIIERNGKIVISI